MIRRYASDRKRLLHPCRGDGSVVPVEPGPDERLKLVFDEALRALVQQQARLDNVRSRATTLTAAATLVASLLGGSSVDRDSFDWAAVLATAATAGVLACSLVIVAPIWHWRFHSRPTQLLRAVDQGFSLDEMRRNMASDFEHWADGNDRKLRRMHRTFTAGLAFLTAEMVGWALHLWSL